jgi:hypothetical protein
VIRALTAAAVAALAALSIGAPASLAANECAGLMVCIPVAGPWVHVPSPGGTPSSAHWQLTCPQGVVGGVDALASERAVAVDFVGRRGSPVNPGITTSNSLWFRGLYAGPPSHPTSFQPFIGCMPAPGGGGRTRTALPVKPGDAIVVRTKTLDLPAGPPRRAAIACRSDERMLSASHAVGIFTKDPPTPQQFASIKVAQARDGRLAVIQASRAHLAGGIADGVREAVQLQAMCAS